MDLSLPGWLALGRRRAVRGVGTADRRGWKVTAALLAISMAAGPVAAQQAQGTADRPAEPAMVSAEEAAAVAADRFALLELRVQAIGLLAEHRTQRVAGVLIDLVSVGEQPEVRAAAFNALANLACVHDIGTSEPGWRAWWAEHRDLPAEVWYQRLLSNFARHNADLAARQKWAQDRLLEAQRLIYEAMPSAERPAALLNMLSDPLDPVRLLGMELIHRRLVEGEPPDNALLTAVRGRLDDRSAAIRRRAALVLRDMADGEAADTLARRLVVAMEKDPAAIRAYLLLLTQVPRKEAVVAALDMLADPRFSAEAAGVLVAAAEHNMLEPRQAELAARVCREHVRDGRLPEPQAIALLGLIGNDGDWVRIEQWLDSDNEAVKEAAALAWGKSDRPLLPLVQRAGDLVIRPNALVAAARRGGDTATLLALVDARLEQDQRLRDWQEALVAMAGRVPPRGVLQAEAELARTGQPVALRERFVAAAIDAQANNEPDNRADALVDLLLRRADIRLESSDFQGAIVDYKRIDELAAALDARQQRRFDRGLLQARLAVGYTDGAVEVARSMLEADNPTPDPEVVPFIIDAFTRAIDRHLEAKADQRAMQTLTALRSLFGQNVPEVYRTAINELDVRVRRASTSSPSRLAPPETTTPSPLPPTAPAPATTVP